MIRLDPYVRYAAVSSFLPNKETVRAYDCRLFFVLGGEGELRTPNECLPLRDNTLAYYPSGTDYFLVPSVEKPLEFVTVNFDFTHSYPERVRTLRSVAPRDYDDALKRPTQQEISESVFHSVFTVEHAFSLRDNFLALASVFSEDERYRKELCSAMLKCIVLKIANIFSKKDEHGGIVGRVKGYVESNYSERLDNHTVAVHFGYHAYYLSSLFKEMTGLTLHQYILGVRLKRASQMLLNTDMSVSCIAGACGFQNPNHFSVKFKKEYKMSPLRYRQLHCAV